MSSLASERGFGALAYGENADDAFQDRPGAGAAQEFRVLAPLRMTGLTKAGDSSALPGAGSADGQHAGTTLSEFKNTARHGRSLEMP